jgi:DNA mismatch repair protein MutS
MVKESIKTADKLTPMMSQYLRIKGEHKDAILFFRLGDFYEMFFEDAVTASKVLQITLTSRGTHKSQKVPLAGIPYHAAESYIAQLLRAGHKVAICEQTEDPKKTKGLVKRKVIRVITSGTTLQGGLLDNKTNNYLAGIFPDEKRIGLAFVDLSTGEFIVSEWDNFSDFISELSRVNPSECLLPEGYSLIRDLEEEIKKVINSCFTFYPQWHYEYTTAYSRLTEKFKTNSLEGFGCENLTIGIQAAGAIIHYLKETQKIEMAHIVKLSLYPNNKYMVLDPNSQRNLELVPFNKEKPYTLLWVLDKTATAMGARLIRRWTLRPLLKSNEIEERLSAVQELFDSSMLRNDLFVLLKKISDIERLLGRLNCEQGNARDLISLKESLKVIPEIKSILFESKSFLLKNIEKNLIELKEVIKLIEGSIMESPPLSLREGGIIKDNYHQELDDLRSISRDGKSWIADLQQKEIKATGINSLKIRYNRVFGYYIGVTNANLKFVPEYYIRKQTLTNGERFITPDLKEYEEKILTAEEKIAEIEYRMFQEIKNKVIKENQIIQSIANYIAMLDVITSFSEVSAQNNYCRPKIKDSSEIIIKDGRHPVLEKIPGMENFVPNDTFLDTDDNRLLIITGPNMAGKSTYIRQAALIVIMAQIGCFVPAKEAQVGVADRIFTRVGAQDELSRGQSTFMVEMNETANIINNATSRSLIVLDEIGRGTSTFDGVSLAWALAEYIHERRSLGARTLFATHYHELAELARKLKGIKNYNVIVREWNEEIIFLRKIVPGSTDKSYGLHVARLAGIPSQIIERAKDILVNMENSNVSKDRKSDNNDKKTKQLDLFDISSHPVLEELNQININAITPLEALSVLQKLKEKL